MKSYGALRRVMLIVVLSILGSYCFGADRAQVEQQNWFRSMGQSAYDMVVSVGSYCSQLWSDFVDAVVDRFEARNGQTVKIQNIGVTATNDNNSEEYPHGEDGKCTDGREDCEFLNHFFNDTYYKDVDRAGTMDMDDSSHYDVDADPMTLIYDGPQQ